jgi:conjugative transfer region protein TrbK
MKTKSIERIPALAAVVLVALAVAACAIQLRGDEELTKMLEPGSTTPDPLATKIAECRAVTYEQKDALSECRKAWAAKRRQFLGQTPPAPSDSAGSQAGSSLFGRPEDESRLPSDHPPIQRSGKE